MPYDLSVDADAGCILVRLVGAVTEQDIQEALDRIAAIRAGEHVDRILCDQRAMTAVPDNTTIFQAARTFSNGRFGGMRLAILRAAMPEGMHLFETTARNRMADVRIFDDEEDAREWLACRR